MAIYVIHHSILGRTKKGEAKGVKKGEARGVRRIALNLKNDGMPIDNIARITNLSVSDIEDLEKKVNKKRLKNIV